MLEFITLSIKNGEFLHYVLRFLIIDSIVSIPSMVLFAILNNMVVADKFKKKTAQITTVIFAVIAIFLEYKYIMPFCFEACDSVPLFIDYVFVLIWVALIAIIYFWIIKGKAIICPKCGAWNDFTCKDVLSSKEYSQWEYHDRAIRNNNGENIGSYVSREQHTYRRVKKSVECNQCGEIWNVTSEFKVD